MVPVARWPVPHRHPLLPIAVSAEVPTSYLLRVENAHSFGTQLRFVSESRLNYSEQRTSLILGIFFGLVGLAVLVSALGALSLKLAATLMFVSAAVSLPARSARLQRLFVGITVLGLLTAAALALVPIDVRMRVLMSCIFLPQLLALATMVWA